jgi:Tol biopolymer transport system component
MPCDGLECDWEEMDNISYDESGADDISPSIAPGGTQVVFASDRPVENSSELATDYEIWTVSTNGTHAEPRTDNSAEDTDPYWGPAP